MSYLSRHWRGKFSISVSLWVNMVGLLIVISYAELFILSKLPVNPSQVVGLTLVSLLFTRAIVFPWQLVGLVRAIENDFIEHKKILKTRALQAFALLSVLFTLVYSLDVVQSAMFYKDQVEVYARPDPQLTYQLGVNKTQQQITISGGLDIGITNAVRAVIDADQQINSAVLESHGGHIYEGRGLSKLFTDFGIDTYVYKECSSACATAFIGGKKRFLGSNGKLGFHQYRIDKGKLSRFAPFYDLRAEQARDLVLFKSRGIKQSFLDKMFDQPASNIWFPDYKTLINAQIVHTLVSREGAPEPGK